MNIDIKPLIDARLRYIIKVNRNTDPKELIEVIEELCRRPEIKEKKVHNNQKQIKIMTFYLQFLYFFQHS